MSAAVPNPAWRCDMHADSCARPARYIVDAKIRIGIDDYEPLSWLVCDQLSCLGAAQLHAETYGEHVDLRPLTPAEAEDITGLVAA